MPLGTQIPKSDRGAMVALRLSGMSLQGIGKRLGYTHFTVASWPEKIACRVWRQVTPEYIHTLNESIPRRMAAVNQAGGAHTVK